MVGIQVSYIKVLLNMLCIQIFPAVEVIYFASLAASLHRLVACSENLILFGIVIQALSLNPYKLFLFPYVIGLSDT